MFISFPLELNSLTNNHNIAVSFFFFSLEIKCRTMKVFKILSLNEDHVHFLYFTYLRNNVVTFSEIRTIQYILSLTNIFKPKTLPV